MTHNLCLETFRLKKIPIDAQILFDRQSQSPFLRKLAETMSQIQDNLALKEREIVKSKIDINFNKTMTNFKEDMFPELM